MLLFECMEPFNTIRVFFKETGEQVDIDQRFGADVMFDQLGFKQGGLTAADQAQEFLQNLMLCTKISPMHGPFPLRI